MATPLTDFFIKQGDTLESIVITLQQPDPDNPGAFIAITRDLTGADVKVHMRTRDGATLIIPSGLGTVVDNTAKTVGYDWQTGDTATATRKADGTTIGAGPHQLEFQITYTDAHVETFPNRTNINIHVTEQVA